MASCTPWMFVFRSSTICEIATFMTLESRTITNCAAANTAMGRPRPPCFSGRAATAAEAVTFQPAPCAPILGVRRAAPAADGRGSRDCRLLGGRGHTGPPGPGSLGFGLLAPAGEIGRDPRRRRGERRGEDEPDRAEQAA